jgi:hypothetical protein
VRRVLLYTITALSLLLCAAILALRVEAGFFGHRRSVYVASASCGVSMNSRPDELVIHVGYVGVMRCLPDRLSVHRWPGLAYVRYKQPPKYPVLAIEGWLAFSVCASLPLFHACRHFYGKGAGFRSGLCRACGYDLRATLLRCPECGLSPVPRTL